MCVSNLFIIYNKKASYLYSINHIHILGNYILKKMAGHETNLCFQPNMTLGATTKMLSLRSYKQPVAVLKQKRLINLCYDHDKKVTTYNP